MKSSFILVTLHCRLTHGAVRPDSPSFKHFVPPFRRSNLQTEVKERLIYCYVNFVFLLEMHLYRRYIEV